jgi:hypothetical protein
VKRALQACAAPIAMALIRAASAQGTRMPAAPAVGTPAPNVHISSVSIVDDPGAGASCARAPRPFGVNTDRWKPSRALVSAVGGHDLTSLFGP